MSDTKPTAAAAATGAENPLRALPAVSAVIESWRQRSAHARAAGGALLAHLAREVLASCRRAAAQKAPATAPGVPALTAVVERCDLELAQWRRDSRTCRVVNATGIILHSGLGRAVLPRAAVEALARLEGYCLLEVDKERGERRKRDAFVEELLCEITGAEAALVVNNNAAATMIILNTLAAGRDVLVSRSQLIEIGGSFRLPDVMEMSGCRLKEVGTTNRSYVSDYDNAIDERTAALMLVHTSNYRIVGFTQHVGIAEMTALGRRRGLPVVHDLGSGSLLALDRLGIGDEPPVQDSVRIGCELICFSGDKMIGGTQAGIIIGQKAWVERCRKNPLARAMRIDKLTCVALEATLKLYLEPERLFDEIPTLRMLRADPLTLRDQAGELGVALRAALGHAAEIELVPEESEMGAGSLPAIGLPTTCVAVQLSAHPAEALARALRRRSIPVFTRVKDDRILIDPRTLAPADHDEIVRAFAELAPGPATQETKA
jgi:L-seryl-tRNA(Ser) seleniumtransferase